MDGSEFLSKRRRSVDDRNVAKFAWQDDYALAECPLLYHMMGLTKINGKSRKLGKLILFAEDGRLKACVKDVETGQVLFVTVDTFETVWGRLDAALAAPDADWRDSRR